MLSVVLQFQNGKNLFNFVFMSTHMCVWHTDGNIVTAGDSFYDIKFCLTWFYCYVLKAIHCVVIVCRKVFSRKTPFHTPVQRRMIVPIRYYQSICWWCSFHLNRNRAFVFSLYMWDWNGSDDGDCTIYFV